MSCYVLQVCIWYILIHYVYVMYMLCVCCLYVTWCWRFSAVKSPGKQSPRRLLSARSGEDTGAELSAGRAQRQFLRARNRRSEERPERHWSHNGLTKGIDRSLTCRRLVTRRGWDHKHNAESDPSTIWVYVGSFDHFWSWLQMTSHGVWKRLNALPHSPWPFQVCHLCPIVTIVATGNRE